MAKEEMTGMRSVNARREILLAVVVITVVLLFASVPAFALREHVYNSSFGGAGEGPGQFVGAQAIALSEVGATAGDVYVLDAHPGVIEEGKGRVEVFTATGTYLSQFNGGASPSGAFLFPQAGTSPSMAIDNSTNPLDPSAGDVYVADTGHHAIDKFEADGVYLGQLTGTCEKQNESPPCTGSRFIPFGEVLGIAVDPAGTVWVSQKDDVFAEAGTIDDYSDALYNEFLVRRETPPHPFGGLAVDGEENIYLPVSYTQRPRRVAKLDSSGRVIDPEVDDETSLAVATDPSSNDLYVVGHGDEHGEKGTSIGVFTPAGEQLERFGAEYFSETEVGAVTVNSTTGTVYAVDSSHEVVRVFTSVFVPDVATGEATGLQSEGAATLNGTVDPEGEAVTSCEFEYGTTTAYGSTVACSPSPGSGSGNVAVSATLTGLITPDTIYHYRLVASSANGEARGEDRYFVASARAVITGESVADVSSTEASVAAKINPGGLPTGYRVEYGPTTSYGSATPEVSAGAGTEAVGVRIGLSGLDPGTLYHARIVATNERGAIPGGDMTFKTAGSSAVSAVTLPDGRVYENVSLPADADGEVYHPITGHEVTSTDQPRTVYPMRASASGDGIVYAAEASTTGGSGSTGDGGGDTFLATRGAGGWEPTDITPAVASSREAYEGFSSDLSQSFLTDFEPPLLAPGAPPNCVDLYARSTANGAYGALFTTTETPGRCGKPSFAGIAADGASVLFESVARLTPEATEGEFPEERNLYDSVGGHAYLVNVLPNGQADVNAAFGGVTEGEEERELTNDGYHHLGQVISADGSRVVWTDLNTGSLYVRKDPASPDASTVLVATDAYYRTASSDGSKVLFTKGGDLYEYDVDTETTRDLTPGGAVLGVLGASEDASFVYFVAEGALASNKNANRERAEEGEPNLYRTGGGKTQFIATLSPGDDTMLGIDLQHAAAVWGDWRTGLYTRTAEVTPDGEAVVFMSSRSLTGYANEGVPEVFVYDAADQVLSCASCNPTGAPPAGAGGALLPTPERPEATYQLRVISDDGDRVFFETAAPLVPADTNGVQDVYEWERAGSGSCHEGQGCVYLLSSDLSGEETFFLDASANGDDVFFTTRAQLVPEDHNEQIDVYDARVDGGFPRVSTQCTGSGCQGAPPAPPFFATPSSVTFNGVGNFPSQLPAKPVTKPLTRAQKLTKALTACRKKRKRQRSACEKLARRRYGPQQHKSKSKSHKGGK